MRLERDEEDCVLQGAGEKVILLDTINVNAHIAGKTFFSRLTDAIYLRGSTQRNVC